MKVAVALSGGVDSSVAAALLVEAGHDVVGITLQQWPRKDMEPGGQHGGCCSLGAVEDARRVSAMLGIPFFVWNLEREFGQRVIEPFHAEYRAGRTPNPCLRCNQLVRFDLMLDRVLKLGFERMATGHYARILERSDGPQLHAAADPAKDQSYVLYHLTRDRLARLLFPLGDMTKTQTRARAAELGLPVATKPDSQEICFVPRGRTADYLARKLGDLEPGQVVDPAGRILGRHRGIGFYTVGQRSGLGPLTEPGPWYVLRLDAVRNRVVVGRREQLISTRVDLQEVTFIDGAEPARVSCEARLRYRSWPIPAIYAAGRLELQEPFGGAAPGQAAVFYRGSQVLGGGIIRSAA